ncbi:CHAT domain-containing protein [Thermanaerothrix sp.]|uniref:CHAT domain-containing protein n=1 Tax=Thermanaerothrix sp. TaxID=2972675 RepID=UPI002ADD94E3|nr:CHAT domain-containing protein [Thermanaerothrix sp.]
MAHSFAQTQMLTCPQCRHTFSADIWLILDADERPDLLARAAQGDLHRLPCPQCKCAIAVDKPLLILRRNDPQACLLFSPAERTSGEQDLEHLNELISMLKAAPGTNWQEDWLQAFQIVPRAFLPLALWNDSPPGRAEPQKHLLDALSQAVRQAIRIIEESGETIHPEEDLQNLLTRRPDLRQRLEDALRTALEAVEETEPIAPSPEASPSILETAASENQEPNHHDVERLITEAGDLGQVLVACLQVRSPQEHKAFLQAHPELLTEAGISLLERLLEHEQRTDVAQMLRFFLQVHHHAREVGVEATFAEIQDGVDKLSQAFQHLLALQEKAENQPTAWPQVLQGWEALAREAEAQGNADLAANARGNLALACLRLYELTSAEAWAIRAERELTSLLAVFTPQTAPTHWATTQHSLGILYRERFERSGNDTLAQQAEAYYGSILEYNARQPLPDLFPFRAAFALTRLAARRRRWEDCLKHFETGRDHLRRLLALQTQRTSKEDWLAEIGGVYEAAAYAAWQKGNSRRAAEILEEGHAQVLREDLERRRAGSKALVRTPYQPYYDDYTHALNRLEMLTQIDPPSRPADWATQYDRAWERLQAAEEALRQHIPGFEYFLRSLPYAEIQRQAQKAPLVYLAAAPHGGLAIVVHAEREPHIQSIPELTQDILEDHVWMYLKAYSAWRSSSNDEATRTTWMAVIDDTTHWLGEVLMLPLIETLSDLGLPPNTLVHVIPIGAMKLLPLHAAWVEQDDSPTQRRYALDDYAFTYLPNAHVHYQIHQHQSAERPAETLLIVENPHPDDNYALRFSAEAVAGAKETFEGHYHHLQGKAATLAEVKRLLPTHAVLYFFTHGEADFNTPRNSGLMLAGEDRLTLNDLYDLNLSQARLAILAACESGVPANLRALNEAVSLPIGWLTAGVPGVIGSLWPVNELSTALLMTLFFQTWRDPTHPCPPWEALRRAQQMLRDESITARLKDRFKSFIPEFVEQTLLPGDIARRFFETAALSYLSHPYYWAGFAYYGL